MTTNKNIENECVHGEELVSYLYDEMPAAGRSVFEYHLADCDVCTDEFAGLSLARLSVYEWHRDEFAAMQTPPMPIPYESAEHVSWFENWFGPIFSAPKWLTAGGAFAAAAIVLGLVLFISDDARNSVSVAYVNSIVTPEARPDKSTSAENGREVEVTARKPLESDIAKSTLPSDRRPPVRISATPDTGNRHKVNDQIRSEKTASSSKRPAPLLTRAAPRLTNFEDEDDNTLRLADLIADIDTDEK